MKHWIRPTLILVITAVFAFWVQDYPIDPWGLIHLKKIATMVFALSFIQISGSVLAGMLGSRGSSVAIGFLGGLISSTATTVALARRSQVFSGEIARSEEVVFLSATLAMLIEGLILMITGLSEHHLSLLMIFCFPILLTLFFIYRDSRKLPETVDKSHVAPFRLLPLFKLLGFIVLILLVSKMLQKFLGHGGLYLLTLLVSLFEMHGSVIANVQLHEAGAVTEGTLGGLMTVSILASYLAKGFLVWTLGSPGLRRIVMHRTGWILFSLSVGWVLSTV